MATDRYVLDLWIRAMLTELGLQSGSVLRRAGIRADLLAGGPARLAQGDFFALWQAIEAESDDLNLPLRMAELFSPRVFSAPVVAGLLSPDLNAAARRIAKYKRLIGPAEVEVDVQSSTTRLSYTWPDRTGPPDALVLSELVFWVQLARIGTRARIVPIEVGVPNPPADAAAYRTFLGTGVTKSDTQSVVFAADDAASEFLMAGDAIRPAFEPNLGRRLGDLESDASFAMRVRSVLLELLPVGRSNIDDVAAQLAMSTRTLYRRLASEKTSFQRVLDEIREDLARHYLSNPNMSASEVSFLLGFEETSSFYRAFNAWTGQTPEQVRSTRSDGPS